MSWLPQPCFLILYQSYDSDKAPILVGSYASKEDASDALFREFNLNGNIDYGFVVEGFRRP